MVGMTARIANCPDGADIQRMASDAVRRLPSVFRDYLDDIVIRVEEFADRETLTALGLGSPWDLTGLYCGRPVSEQSIWTGGDLPPIISLFRRPLLRECIETGVALDALVEHVVVHEVGHHFGLTDDQIQAIEDDAE